jgi:mono/diheme cytochrome c family protein
MKSNLFIILIGLGALAGCTDQKDVSPKGDISQKAEPKASLLGAERTFDFAQITKGRKLFIQNCAVCHRANAEGAPNWRQRDPDGKYPPPPLNGTGHAWHHPMKALRMTIRDGTQKIGGKMPAWGTKLSEQDINDVIAWFQSEWPEEIYQAWYERNEKSK